MSSLATALAVLMIALTPFAQYRIELTRYFASPVAEASSRRGLDAAAAAFKRESPVPSADSLLTWLGTYDTTLRSIQKHDLYVYLRAERDVNDVSDAKADAELSSLQDALNDRVDSVIGTIGRPRLSRLLNSSSSLSRYRYFLEGALRRSAHRLDAGEARAVSFVADPAIETISASYKALRRTALAPHPTPSGADPGEIAFHEQWRPYASHEDAFAAQLISIASTRNGVARLHGYAGAPDSEYYAQSLSSDSVQRALSAVRASDAYRNYQNVLAAAAARHTHVEPTSVRVWDLEATDTFKPADVSFDRAIELILSAEQPMGRTYADAYRQLLDPANGRVDLCTGSQCDRTGFSVGFSGLESGLYFGGYAGTTNDARAIAHEAGHAVHRQFMNEHQSLAVYNSGPSFMFESFAIFNELLFYDHLYKTASSDAERAYYLNKFIDDASFQVFGSAEETDLEGKIYQLVESGHARTAADFDKLTIQVLSEYTPRLAAEPDVRDYWARDSLYYTDPLYDVSYLYAGMLALSYFNEFERDGPKFSKKYVSLLENGFTDSPATLEKRFLGIDLTNEAGLIQNASTLINHRTAMLARLYDNAQK